MYYEQHLGLLTIIYKGDKRQAKNQILKQQ